MNSPFVYVTACYCFQNNKVIRKKSLVFKSPEIEINERCEEGDAKIKRILKFNSLDEVLQVIYKFSNHLLDSKSIVTGPFESN